MELLCILALLVFVACFFSAIPNPNPLKLFEWVREVDGADAHPDAYYVETASIYWVGMLRITDPPVPFCIKGSYPRARFFSLQAYHGQSPFDQIFDFQVDPDDGSINPFRNGNTYPCHGKNLSYTIRLVPVPERSAIPATKPANTLYVIKHPGKISDHYIFTYRVYADPLDNDVVVPDGYSRRAWERQGQQPLIQILPDTRDFQALRAPVVAHGDTTMPPYLKRFDESQAFSLAQKVADGEPPLDRWTIGDGTTAFANAAVVYQLNHFDDSHGEIAVCRFKVPTSPNTKKGAVIDPQTQQTRYWSVCTHIPGTMTTLNCISDHDFITDDDGYVTIVFSTEDKRPANAKNWLPYGWDEPNQRNGALVYIRNLLPSETTFPESPYFYSLACRHRFPAAITRLLSLPG